MRVAHTRKEYDMSNLNNTLLCDFYELTMANGYFELGKSDEIAYFDVFFRKVPDGGGFAIMAGVEQMIGDMAFQRLQEQIRRYGTA